MTCGAAVVAASDNGTHHACGRHAAMRNRRNPLHTTHAPTPTDPPTRARPPLFFFLYAALGFGQGHEVMAQPNHPLCLLIVLLVPVKNRPIANKYQPTVNLNQWDS